MWKKRVNMKFCSERLVTVCTKMNMQTNQRNTKRPKRIAIMCARLKSVRNKSAMVSPLQSQQRRRHASFCHVFHDGHSTSFKYALLLLYGLLFAMFNHCINTAVAFNLENRLPIIKYGDADTYFGYSVAGHITESDDSDADGPSEKWWVIRINVSQNS